MNLSTPIKGIFFDLDGTLNFSATGHWLFPQKAEALMNMEGIYYIPIKRFTAAYDRCTQFIRKNHNIKTLEEEYELFIVLYSMLADYLPELELTNEKIKLIAHDKVYNLENDIFFDDAYDTLSSLSQNYKLGIISDSWPSCENKLKSADIYDLLSCITFSCYLGVCKPDPKMFEHALANIGLPAEQTILVDDNKENLAQAEKIGMQPVLIDTKSSKKHESFLTINSLSEIMEYL